jgi:hypothetical protein
MRRPRTYDWWSMPIESPGEDGIRLGNRLIVLFHRTLRIPEDDRTYPLPPGLGTIPIQPVAAFHDRLPPEWRDGGGFFIPMYQREAMWMEFRGASWKPNAVKVGLGAVDAVTGRRWDEGLHDDPQDYLVCPDQPWLDGINAGDGFVRQFVAMPLGLGYTVEAQLAGPDEVGGLALIAVEPRPGRFPESPPAGGLDRTPRAMSAPMGMGIGAGGRIRQNLYPDRYGLETWDPAARTVARIHILNSLQYEAVTGMEPPPSPIDAATYSQYGLPWFELYDEEHGRLEATDALKAVASTGSIEARRRGDPAGETSVDIDPAQVHALRRRPGGNRREGNDEPESSP